MSKKGNVTVKNTFVHIDVDGNSGSVDGDAEEGCSGCRRRAHSDSEVDSRSTSSLADSWAGSWISGKEADLSRSDGDNRADVTPDDSDGHQAFVTISLGNALASSSLQSPSTSQPYHDGSCYDTGTHWSYQQGQLLYPPMACHWPQNVMPAVEAAAPPKKNRPSRAKRAQAKLAIDKLRQEGYGSNGFHDLRHAVETVVGRTSNKEAFIMKKVMLLSSSDTQQQPCLADELDVSQQSPPASSSSSSARPPPTTTHNCTTLNSDAAVFVPGGKPGKLSL